MLHSICRLTIVFLTFVLSTEAATQVSVRASYGSLGLSQVILPLGVRSGVFQKNGLKFEPVYIAGLNKIKFECCHGGYASEVFKMVNKHKAQSKDKEV